MSWDDQVTLIKTSYIKDEIGNQIEQQERQVVYCNKKSVGRSEFYSANVKDARPEILLEIHAFEYDGQRLVEFNGVVYRVLRDYSPSFETVELTCGRELADAN